MVSEHKVKRGQAIQAFRSSHDVAEDTLLSEDAKKFDPLATAQDCIDDLRALQEEYPDQYITRKFYRKNGSYSDSTWDTKFGTFSEYRRQARLELSRGQHQLERHIAKHASMDIRRGFMEMEILPWVGQYSTHDGSSRWRTIIVASDFHDIETDEFALEVLLDTVKRVQPDKIVLAGDIFDMYEFSRFDKDPRKCDISSRLGYVRDRIFAPLRACSGAQIDMIVGNHEMHLMRHFAERSPEMKVVLSDFMGITFADMLGLKPFKINMICKSDLTAFKASDLRSEISKNYVTYYDTVTVNHYEDNSFKFGTSWVGGHTHKPKLISGSNVPMGALFGMTLGCMCKVDNNYTDGINRNQNGFGIIHVDTTDKTAIPEPVVFSDSGAVVGGIRYTRPQG